MRHPMRASELRWRRSLVGIVIAVLASPIAAASCNSSNDEGDGAPDASVRTCDAVPFDAAGIPDDAADGCARFRTLPCLPSSTRLDGCYLDPVTCSTVCNGPPLWYCQLASVSCNDDAGIFPDATS